MRREPETRTFALLAARCSPDSLPFVCICAKCSPTPYVAATRALSQPSNAHVLGCGERDRQFTGHEGRLLFLLLVELLLVVLAEDHAVEGMLQQMMARLVRDVRPAADQAARRVLDDDPRILSGTSAADHADESRTVCVRLVFKVVLKYDSVRVTRGCFMETLDRTLSALAHPVRRQILDSLMGQSRSVTELAEPFDMSLPAVSMHIRTLEKAGLVTRGRDAQWRPCSLDAAPMRQLADWLEQYRRFWEQSLDRLDAYAQSLREEEAGDGANAAD
jgi:DNA-binding transcriptional ArsR family regulator